MNILKELTKNFQYEENMINPDIRRLISGPFRDVMVNKNGICYSRSGKTMRISRAGFYRSLDQQRSHGIQPWRLCALVWHDQSPSLHLDSENTVKYLNLLSFFKVLENHNDEYELLMEGLKTDYFPLSLREVFNVSSGCLGQATGPFKINHPDEYRKINWGYFNEIGDQIKLDFQDFKDELSEELNENLKNETVPDTDDDVVETVEIEPKEEFDICISDPELGGAPSLIPKTKTDNSSKENNKMDNRSDIPECKSDTTMEAQESSVLDEIKLHGYKDHAAKREKEIDKLIKKLVEAAEKHNLCDVFHLTNELRRMGLTEKEIGDRSASALGIFPLPSSINKVEYDPTLMEVQESSEEVNVSSTDSIDELQKLFDRRAQLKKELAKIDEQIKEML